MDVLISKTFPKMAETKLLSYIAVILGIPLYGYTMYVNLGTWKSDVLFFLMLCILGFNYYWKWRKNLREDRKAAQEERMRQLKIDKEDDDTAR